jgi:uncharacterized protein involved in exopolysaccharide biosynthesis
MTSTGPLRRHWRIIAVAALGALLAFVCSFIVSPTYQASTRLIIHGRDAGFLSSSGQSSSSQTNITDSSQAKALADTYGSIATSRSLATSVVNDVHLDRTSGNSGLFGPLRSAASWVYRCTRAFLTSGFCASVNQREKAITSVLDGTVAQQLGTTAGSTAGQPGAYILEITASGDSGARAQATANAVADELVKASAALVAKSGRDYIDRVQTQLTAARKDVDSKAAVVTTFENANSVSVADQQAVVTATAYDNLRADLASARADLAEAQAQLDSINASLAHTSSTTSSGQTIDTGRSGTNITTDQTNPVYSDLLTSRSQTEAKISGLDARIPVLEGQVANGSPTNLSGTLADLANLQADLTAAQSNRDTLNSDLAAARAQAGTAVPDLTRLDSAGRPDYPVSPKRYLYLLIGLLLGGLAGSGLSWLEERRGTPGPAEEDGDDRGPAPAESPDFEDELLGGSLSGGRGNGRVPAQAVDGPSDDALAGTPGEESTLSATGLVTRPEP